VCCSAGVCGCRSQPPARAFSFTDPACDLGGSRPYAHLLRNCWKLRWVAAERVGDHLLGPEQAPAGTKRVSNLLQSQKLNHAVIDLHLWELAVQRVQSLRSLAADALVVQDASVVKKPETLTSEGLGQLDGICCHGTTRFTARHGDGIWRECSWTNGCTPAA
jgi:hypothetical protein